MRMCDWSSDLCSSDLLRDAGDRGVAVGEKAEAQVLVQLPEPVGTRGGEVLEALLALQHGAAPHRREAAAQGVQRAHRLAAFILGAEIELVLLGVLRIAVSRRQLAMDPPPPDPHA